MKIAIISDLHDNEAYLDRFLKWTKANKIEKIFACGDLCNQNSFDKLTSEFSGQIWSAIGNGDSFQSNELTKDNIHIAPRSGITFKSGEINIGLCHEPKYIKNLLASQPDFIFYGHTHRPDLKKAGMTIIANPGTLGGWQYPSSFAVLDSQTRELQLIISEENI